MGRRGERKKRVEKRCTGKGSKAVLRLNNTGRDRRIKYGSKLESRPTFNLLMDANCKSIDNCNCCDFRINTPLIWRHLGGFQSKKGQRAIEVVRAVINNVKWGYHGYQTQGVWVHCLLNSCSE